VALVKSLKATGKPVVTVVLAGRPLVLGDADGTQGLLMSWLPGSEGGNAVADVLFGKTNPSGRLNVSWPKDIGNEPMYYQQLPGTNGGPESFVDAAYPFGSGLSYTTYSFDSVKAGAATARTKDTIHLAVGVTNSGGRDGDLVVPVYVSQPTSDVLSPSRKLVAFTRVHLKAGQSSTVSLDVPPSRLAVTPGDIDGSGKQQVEPGDYVFTAGAQTATVTVR
jgi:beta-glucosidase